MPVGRRSVKVPAFGLLCQRGGAEALERQHRHIAPREARLQQVRHDRAHPATLLGAGGAVMADAEARQRVHRLEGHVRQARRDGVGDGLRRAIVGARAIADEAFARECRVERVARPEPVADRLSLVLQPKHAGALAEEQAQDAEPFRVEVLPLVDDQRVEAPALIDLLLDHTLRHPRPETRRVRALEAQLLTASLQEAVEQAVERRDRGGGRGRGL